MVTSECINEWKNVTLIKRPVTLQFFFCFYESNVYSFQTHSITNLCFLNLLIGVMNSLWQRDNLKLWYFWYFYKD